MKTVKFILSVFVLGLVLTACAPNHDEDPSPATSNQDLEQFEVKGTEGGSDGPTGKPGPI